MRIAFVLVNLGGGGAQRSVLNLARGLLHRGHEIDLVLFETRLAYADELPEDARLFLTDDQSGGSTENGTSPITERAAKLSGRIRLLDWGRTVHALKWDPRCLPHRDLICRARALAGYMERERPDCVVPSLPRPIASTLLGSRLLRKPPPIIPTLRNPVKFGRRRDKRRFRHLSAYATHFIGISRGVSDEFVATVGAPGSSITTIYNPVVTDDLQSKMAEMPNHPWLGDRATPVILAAGRLVEQKDYATLIKAFAQIAARRPCRLIILGEGSRRQELEELAAELKVSERVSLPGWVENPFAFMARASLFVMSSRFEGLGGVLIQALACGCPSVSTDCPAGPAEILENGRVGPLVPVGDHVKLAEAMERVLDQPPDADSLRERAAYFSVDRAVAAYDEVLSTVVSECTSVSQSGSSAMTWC